MKPHMIIAGKESRQTVTSRRGLTGFLLFSLLLSAFSLLLVSDTELSLLDNAQVVYMMAGVVMISGALLLVIQGCDAYAGEKERGTLIPLLCSPQTADTLLFGKALGLLWTWILTFTLAIPYIWSVGASGQNLIQTFVYLALFGTPALLGFGLLAMALSARTGSVLVSLLTVFPILMLCASPLVLGPGLRATAVGRILDAVNPLAGVLNTLDSVIIDSEPFQAQLARLAVIAAWLGICLVLARTSASKPKFT